MNNIRLTLTVLLAVFASVLALSTITDAKDRSRKEESSAQKELADTTTEKQQTFLGLGVTPLHPALTAQLPEATGKGRGVLIDKVMASSPAEQAGLRVHDVLISYDKQDVYSPEQLVKLVRNDRAGREVAIGYVRGGTVHETTVRLSDKPTRERVTGRTAFQLPLEQFFSRGQTDPAVRPSPIQSGQERPTPWATFKSLTITKEGDNRYKAEIEFRDKDEKSIHREYVGTREEIREAIRADKDLPADERKHLLRSLDQQPRVMEFLPRPFRMFEDLDRELFNYPDVEF